MTRHLVKKQIAAARGKLLASKGRKNRKQLELVADERPEEVSDNEVEEEEVEVEEVENKGGRSPRRAALEAAKKIYYSARNIAPKNDDGGECSYHPRNPTPKSPAPKKIQIIYDLENTEPVPKVEGDLLLECEEDMLSVAQTKLMKRLQKQHNIAMLKIRDANRANERFFEAQMNFFLHK